MTLSPSKFFLEERGEATGRAKAMARAHFWHRSRYLL